MARKAKQTEEILVEPEVYYADPDVIDDAFDEFPDEEAKITIFRFSDDELHRGRPAFIDEMAPSEFSVGEVRRRYGGGRFKAVGKNRKTKTKREMEFLIEGARRIPRDLHQDKKEEGPSHATYLGQPPQSNLEAAMVALSQSIQEGFNTLTGKMLEAALQKHGPSMQELEEHFIQKLSIYKGLFDGNRGPGATVQDTIALAKTMMEAGQQGPVEGQPPWMYVLERFGDKFAPLLDAISKPRTAPMPTPGPQTGPFAERTPMSETSPKQEPDQLTLLIGQYVPLIANMCRMGHEVERATDTVLSYCPEPQLEILKNWLKQDDWFEKIVKVIPAVEPQMGWWFKLREDLIYAIEHPPIDQASGTAEETGSDAS